MRGLKDREESSEEEQQQWEEEQQERGEQDQQQQCHINHVLTPATVGDHEGTAASATEGKQELEEGEQYQY